MSPGPRHQPRGRVQLGPWRNAEHVELATLTYIDWFNQRRLHSELGDIPPAEFEHDYYARTRTQHQVPTPTRT